MIASDLPQVEVSGFGVDTMVGVPRALSNGNASGVIKIGASPASSTRWVGIACISWITSGSKVACVPGVNARSVELADGTVVCTMHAPGNSNTARQRQKIRYRFFVVLKGIIANCSLFPD